jgi:hypothetical protein
MEHPDAQVPLSQTSPAGQFAAPVTSVHDELLVAGVQVSHPLLAVALGR